MTTSMAAMQRPARLKIAISGSPGTGKTTLVRALATRLELAVVEEGLSPLASADQALLQLIASGRPARNDVLAARNRLIQAFLDWTESRASQYARHDRLVADRWEADVLDWWLMRFGQDNHNVHQITLALLRDMQAKSASMNVQIVMPLQVPFTAQPNEEGTPRNNGFTSRVLHNVLTLGLVQQFTPLRVIRVPDGPLSVEQRVDYLVTAIFSQQQNLNTSRNL